MALACRAGGGGGGGAVLIPGPHVDAPVRWVTARARPAFAYTGGGASPPPAAGSGSGGGSGPGSGGGGGGACDAAECRSLGAALSSCLDDVCGAFCAELARARARCSAGGPQEAVVELAEVLQFRVSARLPVPHPLPVGLRGGEPLPGPQVGMERMRLQDRIAADLPALETGDAASLVKRHMDFERLRRAVIEMREHLEQILQSYVRACDACCALWMGPCSSDRAWDEQYLEASLTDPDGPVPRAAAGAAVPATRAKDVGAVSGVV